MPNDPRVDAYLAKPNDFAKPVLKQIRAAVHKGHSAVGETIKWGVPAYVDERGIFCMTAAFKQHCAWVFWTRALALAAVSRSSLASRCSANR
jgi:hypothetical protein